MADDRSRTEVNLKTSICTDTPTGTDIWSFGDPAAQHIANTGIERNGGVTNIYEQETTFPTAGSSTVVSKDGTVIQVDSSYNVRLDDNVIGNVGGYTIYARGIIPTCDDAAWTADATILTVNRSGSTLKLSEWNPYTATVTNSRTMTFATFPSGTVINLAFVRYVDMHYVDTQEFVVNLSAQSPDNHLLRESDLSVHVTGVPSYFGWRFFNGQYVFGQNGLFWSNVATLGFHSISSSGQFGIIDRYPGTNYSRVIYTNTFSKLSSNNVGWGIATAGYTSLGTFTATATVFGATMATATTITNLSSIVALGYSEAAFSRSDVASTTYNYLAQFPGHTPANYFVQTTTFSNTLGLGYGKLTDIYNNQANFVSLRVVFAGSVPSFLSVAQVAPVATAAMNDCIGVPLTNVGEFDFTYTPHVDDNGSSYCRVLYRYLDRYFFIDIRATVPSVSKVSDNLYLVNCISPFNAIDMTVKGLKTGITDYNGRIFLNTATTFTAATHKVAAVIQALDVNSVDPGDKLQTNFSTSGFSYVTAFFQKLALTGVQVPSFVSKVPSDWGINVFTDDQYSSTVLGSADATFQVPVKDDYALKDLLYVTDTRIPFGMGYTFYYNTMITELETIFTGAGVTGVPDVDYDYLCYEVGNNISGQFQSFQLYGQTYIFDGKNIWQTSFNGSLFNGRGNSPICPATGMTLIASSPLMVYFLSSFDNSIYTFDGGRSLRKMKRLNSQESIINGVYNVRDNSLLLNTANTYLWIRDDLITENAKKSTQTSIGIYDTDDGIVIANNTQKWIYSFASLSSSTVVPLNLQTAYFGPRANMRAVVSAFNIYIYSAAKAALTLGYTTYTMDADSGSFNSQAGSQNIIPSMYDTNGVCIVRTQTAIPRSVAISLDIACASKVTITKIVPEFTLDSAAIPASDRSA